MEQTYKILIADSSEDFGLELRRALEKKPEWEVVGIANDGERAIEMVQKLKPDILLLDLLLPRQDGLAVLQRAAELNPAPVSMVVSGFLTDYMASMATKLGVQFFLAKPCEMGLLCERLEELLDADAENESPD